MSIEETGGSRIAGERIVAMYDNRGTVLKIKLRNGEEFKVKVGPYQELVLRPLLFVAVMEACDV